MKRFFRRVKRLIDFIPVIWYGYDFDYRTSIDLFSYQLLRTAEFLDSDKAIGMGATERADKIRTGVELMEKVYDEDYLIEYQDKVEKLYGEDLTSFTFEDTDDPELSKLVWNYERREDSDEVREVIDKLFDESRQKQERAHKLLWRYIEHNIRDWWD